MADPAKKKSDVDLQTLALTAASSAVAAYVVSKVSPTATLVTAAITPVLVALIREALRRPTEAVASALPAPRPLRAPGERAASLEEATLHDPRDPAEPIAPGVRQGELGPVSVHGTGRSARRRRRWRLAVITGLLGFGVAVVLYTVPELLAGNSARSSGATTFFGGKQRDRGTSTTETTTTTTTQTGTTETTTQTTPTPTTVTVPQETVTVPAPATTTTVPTTPTTPAETTPAPQAAPEPAPETTPADPTTP